ncbi:MULTISPECIES: cell division protein FtsL [unclassified Bacillus (in: firmicutes)]|uniref:cell division protein FtsL n=1 Tax=Bacillus TaxID=1386 RepID=UPI00338DB568
MSNLAYQREVKQYQTEQQGQSVVIRRRGSITLGEKILLVMFVMGLMCSSILIISKAFAVYQANIEVQKLQQQVSLESKKITELQKEKDVLSEPERIISAAKKAGLNISNDVKKVD